jgi:hypothetical protein
VKQISSYVFYSETFERRLGGVMVSVIAIGLKVREFNPGRGDECLRAETIRSVPSFGGEVKPETPCKILLHVKESLGKYEQKYLARPNSSFPSPVHFYCY